METNISENTRKTARIILKGAREHWDIIRLSRNLGRTISQTSRLLTKMAAANTGFSHICVKLNWPLNATSGHIYIGDMPLTHGEHSGTVCKGAHVIASRPLKNNRKYCEIFLAVETREYLIYLGINENKSFRKLDEVWLSKNEIINGSLKRIARSRGKYTAYKISGKSRIIHRRGNWVGTPKVNSLISVNSNFK